MWQHLGNIRLQQLVLNFGEKGRRELPAEETRELLDRGLVRCERKAGTDPWGEEDSVELLSSRPAQATDVWLHPGLRRLFDEGAKPDTL